eukprot:15356162-Ditylum_brightwellii.AAC.1
MAMPTGTNDCSKHICFDSTSKTSAKSKKQLPQALAFTVLKSHIALLHTKLQELLESFGAQHIEIKHTIDHKLCQKQWSNNNEDVFPNSAKVGFKFHTSKKVEESEEFKALSEETTPIIDKAFLVESHISNHSIDEVVAALIKSYPNEIIQHTEPSVINKSTVITRKSAPPEEWRNTRK